MIVYALPVSVVLAGARLAGSLIYRLDRRHRQIAHDNIRASFPDMPETEIARIARASLQEICLLAAETMFTTRLIRLDTWRRHIELANFTEALELLVRKERGVIMLTGHFGNWEILGYTLATLGIPSSVVARPLDNPYVNDWLLGVREKKGQRVIDKKGATAEVAEVLERGEAIAFIADQDAGKKGMFVDFFGRPASTFKSIALLAMHYEVPIVVGYAQRLPGVFRFLAGVQEIIHPSQWKHAEDPQRWITQRFTTAIESIVRQAPEQYWWAHRRWKTRPKA